MRYEEPNLNVIMLYGGDIIVTSLGENESGNGFGEGEKLDF